MSNRVLIVWLLLRSIHMSRVGIRLLSVASVVAWVGAVAFGFGGLMWYENQPGASAVAAEQWPDSARLDFDATRWNLVVFLHPHCPCSQSTLTELAVLQSRVTQPLRMSLVFCKPEGAGTGWEKSRILDQAAALPNVSIVWDAGIVSGRRSAR